VAKFRKSNDSLGFEKASILAAKLALQKREREMNWKQHAEWFDVHCTDPCYEW
jgi:hypothetical protein